MLTLEVLIATMDRADDSLLDEMNIQSDVIVCNQNSIRTSYREYKKNGYNVRWYDFQEKGVGLNRNNALMRATADVCLLSDDDVRFVDNYSNIIVHEFENMKAADILVFNIDDGDCEPRYKSTSIKSINRLNCGKFGAVRIAFRRMAVTKNNISFSLYFGGGAMFTAGEDTIFLEDCLSKNLKIYTIPVTILVLKSERESTWFRGYNKKFFEDMGSSYYVHYGMFATFVGEIQLVRHRKKFLTEYKYKDARSDFRHGIKKYKEMR